MDVSVVVPCHRSPEVLQDLVRDLVEAFTEAKISLEIILVVDSTDDRTRQLTATISSQSDKVQRIVLSRNFGQQAATAAGISQSKGSIIVTLDDDYQHSPLDALAIVEVMVREPNIDLIYGVSNSRHQSLARLFTGTIFRRVMKAAGIPFFELFSPLRGFRGYFRRAIRNHSGPTIAIDVALSWVVSEVRAHQVSLRPRTDGKSGYSVRTRLRLALSFLFAQSTAVLEWGIYLGVFGVMTAFALGIRTLYLYLNDALLVPGFATTILVVLFVGSIQLILLGIIGKYIGLQHRKSIGQPSYFIAGQD